MTSTALPPRFDAQDFINKTRNSIADDRRKAVWLKLAGYVVKFLGLAVLCTGLIKGLALSQEFRSDLFVGGFSTLAASVWHWLDANIPPVWWFLRSISPYPTLTFPLTPLSLLSCAGWLGVSFGLMLLGIKLLQMSDFHSLRALELEKVLIHQAPLLLQMYSMRSGQDIDVSGDGNVVNAVNTINHIQERGEKSGGWNGPVGLMAIGVAIAAITKFLHLN